MKSSQLLLHEVVCAATSGSPSRIQLDAPFGSRTWRIIWTPCQPWGDFAGMLQVSSQLLCHTALAATYVLLLPSQNNTCLCNPSSVDRGSSALRQRFAVLAVGRLIHCPLINWNRHGRVPVVGFFNDQTGMVGHTE